MTPFSPTILQNQLDSIRVAIANLLGLSGGSIVSGIVSGFIESREPNELAVSWNDDIQRLVITSGTAIMPSGTAASLPSELSDLTWPEVDRLYLIIQVSTQHESVPDRFWRTQTSIVEPVASVDLVTEADYNAADKSNLVLLAVLSRIGGIREVDTTSAYTVENRPTASIADLKHENQRGVHSTDFNPHGIELNDLQVGGMTLLRQTMSRGYLIPPESDFGIPGVARTQIFNDFWFETIGRNVTPGNYYLVLPSIPTAYPLVVDDNEAMYDNTWHEGTPIIEFSTTRPGPLTITWSSVRDLEIVPHDVYSDLIEYRGIVDGPVVADGTTIATASNQFDLGQFSGSSLDIDVCVDGAGNPAFVPQMIDATRLSDSKSMTADPKMLASRGQIAIALVDSPNANTVAPPVGSINVIDASCIGRYNLLYTVVVPSTTENLALVADASGLFYVASVSGWHGSVYRDGMSLPQRYWNRIDNQIFLEARAYRSASTFTYQAAQSESARFSSRSVQVNGTRVPPSGIAAEASIEILADTLSAGDYVRVTFESGNNPVVATVGSNWNAGGTAVSNAENLVIALNTNTFFWRRAIASSNGAVVSIMARKLGADGNAYRVDGSTAIGNGFDISSFSGGGPYAPNKSDLVGLRVSVNQPQSDFPPYAHVRVYITGRIDQNAKDTIYYKLADLPFGTQELDVTSAYADAIDKTIVYDVSKKLSITLQLAGLDQNGQEISETMTIDDVDCFEPIEPLRHRSALVYSTNVWSKLKSWTVTDSSNLGNTKLLVMTAPSSRDAGAVTVGHVSYYGKVTKVLDGRILKPSTLSDEPVDQAAALVGGLALKAFR